MAISIYNLLANDGGRVEFVFFIHGLPWAVSTHADVAAALSDTGDADVQAYRKKLFGHISFTDGVDTWIPSYSVPILDTLDSDIGKQSFKWDEKNQISGGDWSVSMTHGEPLTVSWSHRAGTIGGLEGLDVVPNDAFDSTICIAQLSRNLSDSETTIYWKNDVGDKLNVKVAAKIAADTPAYIWIGNQVVAAYDDLTDEGDGEWSATIARGIWKSVSAPQFTETYDGASVIMSDAPIGGIAGRPATLYAVPMDDANILDMSSGPVRFREGPCMPSSTASGGKRKVQVHGWKKWLEQPIKAQSYTAHMRGYHLCRASSSDAHQAPHIELREWTGAAYQNLDIWLCDAGEDIFFETIDQIAAAVSIKLAEAYVATDISQLYTCEAGRGIMHLQDPTGDIYTKMAGPLPWLLGWGTTSLVYLPGQLNTLKNNLRSCFDNSSSSVFTDASRYFHCWTVDGYAGSPISRESFKAKYIHQYGWNQDTAAEWQAETWEDQPYCRNHPAPQTTGDGSQRMYIDWSTPVGDVSYGGEHQIGNPAKTDPEDRPWAGYFAIESKDTADNYIDLEDNPNYYWTNGADDSTVACVRSIDGDDGPFCRGAALYWIPAVHGAEDDDDPWAIREANTVSSAHAVKILRGVLGASTNAATVPPRFQIRGVPHAYEDGDDWEDNINWAQLGDLLDASPVGDCSYSLPLNSDVTYLGLYHGLLAFHGIAEALEYVESTRGWRFGYRPATSVNATTAQFAGRSLGDAVRIVDDNPETISANTWLYSRVSAKCNHDGEKYKLQIEADDKSGRTAIFSTGKDSEYKAECKLTQIDSPDPDALLQYFGSLLKFVAIPHPEQRARCTTSAIMRLALGREALVTNAYARNPYTGELGVDSMPVLVTQLSTSISEKTAGVDVTYRYCPRAEYGYAPSLLIDVGGTGVSMVLVGTNITVTGLATDPANNVFGDPADGLTDLERFDCLIWNSSTDEVEAADCSCGNHVIIVFDRHVTTYDNATPGRNYWTGTIGSVDGGAGSCVITLANADDFNVNTDKIVIYASYDDCVSCQKKYLFFADSGGEIGAGGIVGRRWT